LTLGELEALRLAVETLQPSAHARHPDARPAGTEAEPVVHHPEHQAAVDPLTRDRHPAPGRGRLDAVPEGVLDQRLEQERRYGRPAQLRRDVPHDLQPLAVGLGDRGLGGFVGTTLALRRGPLQLALSGARGVEQRMGAMATAGLSGRLPAAAGWFAQVGGLAVFTDEDYMMWDFGVTLEQAVRRGALLAAGTSGLGARDSVPFTPGGGLREWRATLVGGRALSSRITLSTTAALVRLEGDAARSPLTRRRTSWEAGAGLSWRF
jgi:hypothetical protein